MPTIMFRLESYFYRYHLAHFSQGGETSFTILILHGRQAGVLTVKWCNEKTFFRITVKSSLKCNLNWIKHKRFIYHLEEIPRNAPWPCLRSRPSGSPCTWPPWSPPPGARTLWGTWPRWAPGPLQSHSPAGDFSFLLLCCRYGTNCARVTFWCSLITFLLTPDAKTLMNHRSPPRVDPDLCIGAGAEHSLWAREAQCLQTTNTSLPTNLKAE